MGWIRMSRFRMGLLVMSNKSSRAGVSGVEVVFTDYVRSNYVAFN